MAARVHYEIEDGFRKSKAIDGQIGREWGYPVFVSRATALDPGPPAAAFYEPLSTLEQVRVSLGLNLDLRSAGAPDSALLQVGLGFRWYRSGFYAPGGRLPPLSGDDEFVGRHYSWLVTFNPDREELVFMNRWTGWGDNSLGYLAFSMFDDYVEDIWLNRSTYFGPSPALTREIQTLGRKPGLEDFRHAWSTEREPVGRDVLIGDRRIELYRTTVRSTRTGRTVVVFELRNGLIGVGRAHVHVGGKAPALIDELFVRPTHRRRGYGTFLLEQMLNAARRNGHSSLEGPIYLADEVADSGPEVLVFLDRAGFEVIRAPGTRPDYRYTASRTC